MKALEDFAAGGGRVLLTADCTLAIKGGTKLSVGPRMPDQEKIDEIMKANKCKSLDRSRRSRSTWMARCRWRRLFDQLAKAGNTPRILDSTIPTIAASRQAAGDIEYFFAVNATPDREARDEKGEPVNNGLLATAATLHAGRCPDSPGVRRGAMRHALFPPAAPGRLPTWQTFSKGPATTLQCSSVSAPAKCGPSYARLARSAA